MKILFIIAFIANILICIDLYFEERLYRTTTFQENKIYLFMVFILLLLLILIN